MSFYDTQEGIDQYLEMAEGFDGRALVDRLSTLLPGGARVLELGIGPGKDLDMLSERYEAIGSDTSALFVERYRARVPGAALVILDAQTLRAPGGEAVELGGELDAIYSNKVLQHLDPAALTESLRCQGEASREGAVLFHGMWRGDGPPQVFSGMTFHYYDRAQLESLTPAGLSLELCEGYAEMEPEDSILVVWRVRGG